MKRLVTLALALCMVLGAAAQSSAIEVQVSGVWDTNFRFDDNLNFSKDDQRDHFWARSRFRPQVEFIASENLRGVIQFQIGSIRWGDPESGGQLDTNSSSAYTRRAYIDWNVADTSLNFKIGLQHMAFPSAVRGNPFFGGNVAGVMGTVGFTDEVALTALWARTFVDTGARKLKDNQTDMFGLILDVNMDKFSISPWVAYASVGTQSGQIEYGYDCAGWDAPNLTGTNDEIDAFAGGIALKINPIDRLSIGFDGAYSTANYDGNKITNVYGKRSKMEGDGYFFALTVDYALDWGTPGAFAWYSSGDSKNDRKNGKWGRMLNLGQDDGVAMTRMGFMGSYGHGLDTVVTATGAGTWGVGLQIADMSFIEKLSHTIRVAYYQGTNDKLSSDERTYVGDMHDLVTANMGEVLYLTKEDQAFEVNFDHKYQIYENFTAVLELGWIYMDLDKKGLEYNRRDDVDKNAYNAQIILRYAF